MSQSQVWECGYPGENATEAFSWSDSTDSTSLGFILLLQSTILSFPTNTRFTLLFQLHRKIQTELASSQSGNPKREDLTGQLEQGKYLNRWGRALSPWMRVQVPQQQASQGKEPKEMILLHLYGGAAEEIKGTSVFTMNS